MKKFMKAIAFVTVMCMALSTVAFAATVEGMLDGATAELSEKVLNITVTGAEKDEQVALMVVASTAADNDFSAPLYIDQKASAGDSVGFTAVLTNATVDAVDIYVGYSSWAAGNTTARKIGEDVQITEGVTEITITKVAVESVTGVQAEADLGDAYAFSFTADGPEGVYATKMVWAISYTDKAGNSDTRYSEAIDVSSYLIGAGMSGTIELGVAFSNGSSSVVRPIEAVTIDSVDAIFLFNDADKTVKTTDNKNFKDDYVQK